MQPTEKQCDTMRIWILGFQEVDHNIVVEKLRQLEGKIGIHPDIMRALENATLDETSKDLLKAILSTLPATTTDGTIAKSWQSTVVDSLFELRSVSGIFDLSRCGDISLAAAVDFCIPYKRYQWKCDIRCKLLEHTGFRHATLLVMALEVASQCEQEKK
jgi:hypothetical protein